MRILSDREVRGLRNAAYFLWGILTLGAVLPASVTLTLLAAFFAPSIHIPIFSDIVVQYPLVSAGVFIFGVGIDVFLYAWVGRMLRAPIADIGVTVEGIFLTDSNGQSAEVRWSNPRLDLKIDVYSAELAEPQAEGYHWGRARFVGGYPGGWCQVDDHLLGQIRSSAMGRDVEITSRSRRTLEGEVERFTFRTRPSTGV
jgi:hypothetical protein